MAEEKMKTARVLAEGYSVQAGKTIRTYGEGGKLTSETEVSVDTRSTILELFLLELTDHVPASELWRAAKTVRQAHIEGDCLEDNPLGRFVRELAEILCK